MFEYGDKHLKPDHFKSGVSLETSTKCQMYPGSVISWESLHYSYSCENIFKLSKKPNYTNNDFRYLGIFSRRKRPVVFHAETGKKIYRLMIVKTCESELQELVHWFFQ